MGKLVLYFPDGSTREILLDKERTTIGRRADNDVPLPSPAVSAEHAAVITVLDDSFLEDLGSTNGTFVNEKPVTKHFLRDRDRIDVGREILIYYTDEAAAPDVLPPEVFHHDTGSLLGPLDAHLAALEDFAKSHGRKGAAETTGPRPVVAEFDPMSIGPMTGQVTTEFDSVRAGGTDSIEATRPVRVRRVGAGPSSAVEPSPPSGVETPQFAFSLQVLDGPSEGRIVPISKAETRLGRVGVQVAALQLEGASARLVPLEGAVPPRCNGSAVPGDGVALKAGDRLEVAGTTLVFREG